MKRSKALVLVLSAGMLFGAAAPVASAAARGAQLVPRTELVGASTAGRPPNSDLGTNYDAITPDGRYVLFYSDASNLVPGDTNGVQDVFLRDRRSGVTTRVSVGNGGQQGNETAGNIASISADGRYVAFVSAATNLVPGDTNRTDDIFLRDRRRNTTTLVSRTAGGALANAVSLAPSLSADGRRLLFISAASNLVPGDTNAQLDAFVLDLPGGAIQRVSVSTAGRQGNGFLLEAVLSADGSTAAFAGPASTLVPHDTNGKQDVFVRDIAAGSTTRVSVSSSGGQGNSDSVGPVLSSDGHRVGFLSGASNLVTGDTNMTADVFVRDRTRQLTRLVSVSSAEVQGNDVSIPAGFSPDGRYLGFTSFATNLVTGDTNRERDVFIRDFATGTTRRASLSSTGEQGNGPSAGGALSRNARVVLFDSRARNLVAQHTNSTWDTYVRVRY